MKNLKTPSFWYRQKHDPISLLEKVMIPVSKLYEMGYYIHQTATRSEKADLPIICIGNINAGGSGKTPTALALLDIIKRHSLALAPYFLSRGYGGGDQGPLVVDPAVHDSWNTGDEPLLLATRAPTIVASRRLAGADLAQRRGADLIIMDDGLQNPGIHKDIKFVVINGDMGFGNERILPAGPLRAPLESALSKIDAVIFIGEDRRGVKSLLPSHLPVFTSHLKPDAGKIPPKDKHYLAFAGLGYPEKFFRFLREEAGLSVIDSVTFADHYPYTDSDISALAQKARQLDAELITTEKDMTRVPKQEGLSIHVLPVHLEFENEPSLASFIKEKMTERKQDG